MKPTQKQIDKTKELAERFNKDWCFNPATKEIKLIDKIWYLRILDFLWPKKHTVYGLYWWVKHNWTKHNMMAYSYPIQGDNMPVKGLPLKFELINGWSIPKKGLKRLYDGPLMSAGLDEILVPYESFSTKLVRWVKTGARVALLIIPVIAALGRYNEDIGKFIKWIFT